MTLNPDNFTDYQKLWEHVTPSYPLYLYDAPEGSIDLGPFTTEGDLFDSSPGPMHYWYKELASGIRIVLQRPADDHDRYRFINVYADKLLIDQVIKELDIRLPVTWRTDSHQELWQQVQAFYKKRYSYALTRLDDNNNEYVVESNLCEEGARCMAYRYEMKGHKQSYFVRKIADLEKS